MLMDLLIIILHFTVNFCSISPVCVCVCVFELMPVDDTLIVLLMNVIKLK